MNVTKPATGVDHRVEGTVQRVDTLARELRVLVDGSPMEFIVPPDCVIWLNQERVKLRLVQPGDPTEVAFSFVGGVAFAHAVRVGWPPARAPGTPQRTA